MPNPAFGGQFGPESKLSGGQPNVYDVICRNALVLAFHLWPTIFAGAPFRLQNICQNGVPPRSRTIAPLASHTKLFSVAQSYYLLLCVCVCLSVCVSTVLTLAERTCRRLRAVCRVQVGCSRRASSPARLSAAR